VAEGGMEDIKGVQAGKKGEAVQGGGNGKGNGKK